MQNHICIENVQHIQHDVPECQYFACNPITQTPIRSKSSFFSMPLKNEVINPQIKNNNNPRSQFLFTK